MSVQSRQVQVSQGDGTGSRSRPRDFLGRREHGSAGVRQGSSLLLLGLFGVGQVRGGQVENFSLQDYRGKRHELADYADRQVVVIAVLGVECPLAKLYAPRLAKLEAEYRDRGVGFLAIDANVQDSITEIAAYASRHGIEFPILKDTGNKVADALEG